eukprot:1675598-Rhodomonas_salina.1
MELAGLRVHGVCEKGAHPRSTCRACGKLFSRLMSSCDAVFPVGHAWHGANDNTVAEAVRGGLDRISIDATGFCCKSLRVG